MLLVKLIEPPCTERYARWCERSEFLKRNSSYSILILQPGTCHGEENGLNYRYGYLTLYGSAPSGEAGASSRGEPGYVMQTSAGGKVNVRRYGTDRGGPGVLPSG